MSPSVAVLGSLHLDIVVHAPRLPLLGETLMGNSWSQIPGGKGLNQAVACARAGIPTQMLGLIGDDDFSAILLTHLRNNGVSITGVKQVEGQRSGMSVATLEASGDYAAVVVSEVNMTLDAKHVHEWEFLLQTSSALVLQNEISVQANSAAARFMAAQGRPVILNAAPARELSADDLTGVSVLVVNAVEAEMMGSSSVADLESAMLASQKLNEKFGTAVVVTAGPHGAAWTETGRAPECLAGKKVQVISTLGAGDAFIGKLAACLVENGSLSLAVAKANEAAAEFVSTPR